MEDKLQKNLNKLKYSGLQALNFERGYKPSKVEGMQGAKVVSDNPEPYIEPIQVTEGITPTLKGKVTKTDKGNMLSRMAKAYQRFVDDKRAELDSLPRDNQLGNLGLGIAEIGQDYLDLSAHPIQAIKDFGQALSNPKDLAAGLYHEGIERPIQYFQDPQAMYENPAYPLQYINNLMATLEGGRQLGNLGKGILKNSKNAIDAHNEMVKYYHDAQNNMYNKNTPPKTDIAKTFEKYRMINPFDKDITPEGIQKFYDYIENGYTPKKDTVKPLGLYNEVGKIDPLGNLDEFVSTGKIKQPFILKDTSFYPEETLVDMENLPKQNPIARDVDLPFEEPKVATDSQLKNLQRKNEMIKTHEATDNYQKKIDALGGKEEVKKMLDAIPSDLSPEDLAKYRPLYIANQMSKMGGGNTADVLANINRQTVVDPALYQKGAFGSYSPSGLNPVDIEEVSQSLKPVNEGIDFNKPVYRILPEGILREGSSSPFLGHEGTEVAATNTLMHEMTHGLNDFSNKIVGDYSNNNVVNVRPNETSINNAVQYNRRFLEPQVTNESTSHAMESLGLTDEILDPRLIEAYGQLPYDAKLTNPRMLNYRNMYQQDIDNYKKMIDLGIIKPDDATIFHEQELMRRFNPDYVSPEVQRYLYDLDDLGGKIFEGFNGQW